MSINIDIDKLISELEARKKSHEEKQQYKDGSELSIGMKLECDFWLLKLIALKNEQPEAITEDSHFRKHDVGRNAACEEIPNIKNDTSESSSETQTVGQN